MIGVYGPYTGAVLQNLIRFKGVTTMSENPINAWRCTMCGYIHRGSEPPEWCPVCGASKDLFEPYSDEAAPKEKPGENGWRCLNCSYTGYSEQPPGVCPVCGARADRFEAVGDADKHGASSKTPSKVVIAGAGIAGVSAAEAIHAASPETEIVLLSKESEPPYFRLNLTRFLAGELAGEDLYIHPENWYGERNIRLMTGEEVTDIDPGGKTVGTNRGRKEAWDRLIMTAGSHPFVPPLPGGTKDGVTTLRTVDNAIRLLDAVRPGTGVVSIGGGILGIEIAGALARRGAEVTLLEGYDYPMPRQLNASAGLLLSDYIARTGITLKTSARADEILGDERVHAVRLKDGTVIPADIVIIATGVRPNSYLARRAGLDVNSGIIVNDYLETSHPDVLAAGDIAEHRGTVYGTWSPAQFQGTIAGLNAAGDRVEFGGVPRSNSLKVLDLDLFSIGIIKPEDASYDVFETSGDGKYFGFVFHDSHLAGAILLGDTKLTSYVKNAVESGEDFSDLLGKHPGPDDIIDHFAGAAG